MKESSSSAQLNSDSPDLLVKDEIAGTSAPLLLLPSTNDLVSIGDGRDSTSDRLEVSNSENPNIPPAPIPASTLYIPQAAVPFPIRANSQEEAEKKISLAKSIILERYGILFSFIQIYYSITSLLLLFFNNLSIFFFP
jgi:hypothetical protein